MRRRFVLGAMTLACALCLAPGAFAASNDLFFSEYVEGSSNNKALEIYNGTGAPIDLGTAGYSVRMFFNGNPASTLTNRPDRDGRRRRRLRAGAVLGRRHDPRRRRSDERLGMVQRR